MPYSKTVGMLCMNAVDVVTYGADGFLFFRCSPHILSLSLSSVGSVPLAFSLGAAIRLFEEGVGVSEIPLTYTDI